MRREITRKSAALGWDWTGKRVAFTGRLAAMSRRAAGDLLRQRGGTPTESVSRRTDLLVVGMAGWPVLADGSVSLKLRLAETLQDGGAGIEILAEETFLQRLQGATPHPAAADRTCTLAQAARALRVDPQVIRRCEQFGLIRSIGGALAFRDLVSLRAIIRLLDDGMSPAAIAQGLARLSRHLPEVDQPLAQVRLIREGGGELLAELQGRRIDGRGQLVFIFEPLGPAPSIELLQAHCAEAERLFAEAAALEEAGAVEAAMSAYSALLERDPRFAEAHFNLGNLLLQGGRLGEAERRYRLALEADPVFAAALYNLGYLYVEQDRYEEAGQALARALEIDPAYADARFNLALCCEQLGRRREAVAHWRDYLRLQPRGECADFARRQIFRPADHPRIDKSP